MKTIVIAVGLVIAMGVVLQVMNDLNTTEVQWGSTATTTELVKEVLPEEVDVVESARVQLERINTQLDEEETRLLEEKKAIDARLEQIRETRTSFQ